MMKLMTLLTLLFVGLCAFAQDIALNNSFPSITRKTGGARYAIPLTQPAKKLTLNLVAVLANPRLAAHKIRIHNVSIRDASGAILSIHQGAFLTGTASRLSVNINTAQLIEEIIIQAESFAAVQRLDVAIEGNAFVDEDAVLRAEEMRRQSQCSATLVLTQQQLSRCEDELKISLHQLQRTQLEIQHREGRLSALEAPIEACLSETSKYESAVQETRGRLEQQREAFQAIKAQVAQTLSTHGTALNYPDRWECVMSDVGHRSFWRSGTGRYVGRGATPARALEAAMKTCPGTAEDGCGHNEDLKAKVTCRPLNEQKES